MKAFIIYIKGHEKSEEYAKKCLESCKNKFDAELFEGVTPDTLPVWENKYNFKPMKKSRAFAFENNLENIIQSKTKKSLWFNGFRLWQRCLELDEPIAILEHDSHCIKPWDNINFDELLILNFKSAFQQKIIKKVCAREKIKIQINNGLNRYIIPYEYHHQNEYYGSYRMPGAAAYAVTPKGAKKLIDAAYKFGWEQNDHFLNTFNVNIETIIPEYFTFKLPNIKTSWGTTS